MADQEVSDSTPPAPTENPPHPQKKKAHLEIEHFKLG